MRTIVLSYDRQSACVVSILRQVKNIRHSCHNYPISSQYKSHYMTYEQQLANLAAYLERPSFITVPLTPAENQHSDPLLPEMIIFTSGS